MLEAPQNEGLVLEALLLGHLHEILVNFIVVDCPQHSNLACLALALLGGLLLLHIFEFEVGEGAEQSHIFLPYYTFHHLNNIENGTLELT